MGNQMSDVTILQAGEYKKEDVEVLKNKALEVIDIFGLQVKELFRIKYPGLKEEGEESVAFLKQRNQGDLSGSWVYYPWKKTLLHCVSKDDLYVLRTNRNKNIITDNEQLKLKDAVVGVAGMSVGAGIASALAYSGISETIKIADYDELDTSNLNRLRENLLSIGKKKTVLAKQHILELDPFIDVQDYSEGLDESNIDSFFATPALTVVVDEIDDFKMKLLLRLKAKEYKIPLLMFTSLGDNILIDVERHDIDSDLMPFHGIIDDLSEEILKKDIISDEDIKKYSVQLVGAEYIPTRALESVADMGKTLVGRPQLYSTIAIDGGLGAYVIRRLALDGQPQSGRYFVKLAELIGTSSDDLNQSSERKAILDILSQR